ncbi:MAG: DUF4179 domain-containing protein [Acinetobacter sp.]|nr:DUF4179 domain-containing protein [Acinetobacter sp.]MBP6353990.1 DUF4179 domain-containing protein [Acinetobacter sp.]MBP7217554.1 DUF4179 domain-containing protein [Acinetobacter sp.]
MQALKYIKILSLSSFLLCAVPSVHAAAIKKNNSLKSTDKSASLIVKTLDQQKRNPVLLPATDDELKMLNNLRTTPTQNFFAAQHERFSRFVQSIFQPHSS